MGGQGPHLGHAQHVTHAGFRPGKVGRRERLRDASYFVPLEDLLGNRIATSTGRYGFVVWLEPANSLRPVLISTIDRALPSKLPSFARVPSTVTSSPMFTELGVQPARRSALGLPSSSAQFSILPDSPFFTSM